MTTVQVNGYGLNNRKEFIMKEKNYRYHCKYYVDGSKKEEMWIKRYTPDPTRFVYYTSLVHLDDGEYELYREDYENPVFIAYLPDGFIYNTLYLKDGKPHRLDGPAVDRKLPISTVRVVKYYIEGHEVSEDDPRLNLLS